MLIMTCGQHTRASPALCRTTDLVPGASRHARGVMQLSDRPRGRPGALPVRVTRGRMKHWASATHHAPQGLVAGDACSGLSWCLIAADPCCLAMAVNRPVMQVARARTIARMALMFCVRPNTATEILASGRKPFMKSMASPTHLQRRKTEKGKHPAHGFECMSGPTCSPRQGTAANVTVAERHAAGRLKRARSSHADPSCACLRGRWPTPSVRDARHAQVPHADHEGAAPNSLGLASTLTPTLRPRANAQLAADHDCAGDAVAEVVPQVLERLA